MGTNNLFSQLDLGKRSLSAHQAGLGVVGHNIANINNENYSRQRLDLTTQHPPKSRYGTGVNIEGVGRITDRFINNRLIAEQGRGGSLTLRQEALRRLENLFNDTEGLGLRNPLNDFWDSWGKLANEPENELFRKNVLSSANSLANRFQGMAKDMNNVREEMNGRIALQVERVNQLAQQLAKQNTMVQQVERGSGQTNDLRDEREATLKELSSLVQIEWYEDEDFLTNVSLGEGWPLVLGRRSNLLEASYKNDEPGYFSLRGIDSKGRSHLLTEKIKGGELKELFQIRDETVPRFQEQLDDLASELAFRVNRLHTAGTGINSTFDKLTSSFALRGDALDKPLPFVKDGSFRIRIVNDDNELVEAYEIPIMGGQDTIRDVIARINMKSGPDGLIKAQLNNDGSVTLASRDAYRFILGRDETDFPVVMGFNNFFENLAGAKDMRVNSRLMLNPNQISTGQDLLPGNNTIASQVHGLQFQPTMDGSSATFDEYYNGLTAELGLIINRGATEKRNQDLVIDQYQKMRDEISSVNMDEEIADMVQYQRGFDASAKFLTTVDEMTRTVVNM